MRTVRNQSMIALAIYSLATAWLVVSGFSSPDNPPSESPHCVAPHAHMLASDEEGPEPNKEMLLETAKMPQTRQYSVCAWVGGNFVVWGGVSTDEKDKRYINAVVYDSILNRWNKLPDAPIAPRVYPAIAALDDHRVLIWGGEKPGSEVQYYTDGAIYDLKNNTVTLVEAGPMPARTSAQMAMPLEGYLVVCGGQSTGTNLEDDVTLQDKGVETFWYEDGYIYNLKTKTWDQIPDSPAGGGMSWGFDPQYLVYVDYFDQSYRFNVESFEWETLEGCEELANSNSYSMSTTEDGEVIVTTGEGTIGIFDKRLLKWKVLPVLDNENFKRDPDDWINVGRTGKNGAWYAVSGNGKVTALYNEKEEAWDYTPEAPYNERYVSYVLQSGETLLFWGGNNPEYTEVFRDGALYDRSAKQWTLIDNCPLHTEETGSVYYRTIDYNGDYLLVCCGTAYPENSEPKTLEGGIWYNFKEKKWSNPKNFPVQCDQYTLLASSDYGSMVLDPRSGKGLLLRHMPTGTK